MRDCVVCRVPRVPMLHLHLYMFESPAPGACLADCLSASFLLYIHISPTTNQYTSQFVSRLYQQQQQQIAVQQYKVRARVRDQYFTFAYVTKFSKLKSKQDKRCLFIISVIFIFATTKTTSSKSKISYSHILYFAEVTNQIQRQMLSKP